MIRKSNFTSYPRYQSGKEEKDEQYQLELATIEILPWNDQYKINGGVRGLNPPSAILFILTAAATITPHNLKEVAIPPAAVRVKIIYPAAGWITSYWPGKENKYDHDVRWRTVASEWDLI